ncbi:hypothetical protein HBZS_117810 [Helicobacter bizzozeronii CCUG 35545]|nr:hypothetical protein HBZS_117810 [Helicobacter bizzozeronii CCUG 35545]
MKNRFLSFGIVAGAQFVLLHHSLQKSHLEYCSGARPDCPKSP